MFAPRHHPLLYYALCAAFILLFFVTSSPRNATFGIRSSKLNEQQEVTDLTFTASTKSPFKGAFARFPTISDLPFEQRRITVVGVWNDDYVAPYLRHFFHTIQLNADSIDLLMINRLITPGKKCLDLAKAGVNITWGGNIKLHCIDDKEWKERHAKFVCSKEYGWDCSQVQFREVLAEFKQRHDSNNYNWRPFRGYVFHDLFANPRNPFWAWVDHDVFVGNFAKYPFNILSQVSILTGYQEMASFLYLAGQLTAFNIADRALGLAWKRIPEMQTPERFTKYAAGKGMPETSEERYWSYLYLGSKDNLPGSDLSWVMYPEMHGDDHFDGRWGKRQASQTYVISGRELLLVSTSLTREEMEGLILSERNTTADELGGIGWTGGEDGSDWLVKRPSLSSAEAKSLASHARSNAKLHQGIVEDQEVFYNCSGRPLWKQCVPLHPMAASHPPIYRQSLVRFKEQPAGRVLIRLERDDRPRGYERRLIKHFLKLKKEAWFAFPPFEITDNLIFRVNCDSAEVWEMGSKRDQTLFLRQEGTTPIS